MHKIRLMRTLFQYYRVYLFFRTGNSCLIIEKKYVYKEIGNF